MHTYLFTSRRRAAEVVQRCFKMWVHRTTDDAPSASLPFIEQERWQGAREGSELEASFFLCCAVNPSPTAGMGLQAHQWQQICQCFSASTDASVLM